MAEFTGRRILKWLVPVDDQWHLIQADPARVSASAPTGWLPGNPPPRGVHFWAAESGVSAWYRIFGTGQPTPAAGEHVSTCLDGMLVWHLIAVVGDEVPHG